MNQTLHIHPYEKGFIIAGVAMLVVFITAVAVSGFVAGIQVPTPFERIDPNTLDQDPYFATGGVRELAPLRYEVHIRGQAWVWTPSEVRVPAGSTVTFFITSQDVQHGFKVQNTNINIMVLPGQVSKVTYTFKEPGEYYFICHEYCGVGHQNMFGVIIVE
jgi:cytochrome c oxidase subunit 2